MREAHGSPPGITLVLGGARSGKSAFAERLVADLDGTPVYIATGRVRDDEMRLRIEHHRDRRGAEWRTVEEPENLERALTREARPGNAVLVDCLTLWITNLMLSQADINVRASALCQVLSEAKGHVVLVSNEVGLGIVPDNAMAREFRDHAGRLHQDIAALADEVFFVAAGLPLKMKG
ncbi:bifunctional adenosylcobinamide kinase/adenosylcobinamide-phosphate guanylyltransferase [Oricola cellulosilytica]|uniref:Bifunctional adenosylcobalamin biosynthesis protein n=1 Tax=Oricola cellulosilytica TaxID=1429082 RepID=A0A4R0PE39_9HYPH|nr:bifunctional adenosylcobinamide kinase/adenosylcobinamide-phosphate guanylyltransferase [Oricola cellulosilytica]TCD15023.1 bifunctional adenosylcobinamide kinase/adenosylcobinamide-phosphate guanylyltransferase [Oricola cellulosilytica]